MNENLTKKITMLLAPQSVTHSATLTANLDTLGADYATIMVPLQSAINTNAVGPTIQLLECDTTVATSFTTFNSAFDLTNVMSTTVNKNVVYHVDTRTRKRYIQLSIVTTTATNDTVTCAAMAVLGRLGVTYPAASNQLGSTNDVVYVG